VAKQEVVIMNFEEWWNVSGASVIHKEPKDAARDAWQSAYMQASAEMRDYIIDDVDYAEQDAVLEVDGVNLYFQFEKQATLKEAVKYFKRELNKLRKSDG
jgi:predicted HTH domain antitoxin